MMTETQTQPQRRPVIFWFLLFFASLGAMGLILDQSDISDPLIANAMMLVPMIFLVKAGLNAMHNAGRQGERGSPQRNYLMRMLVVSLAYVGSLFAATSLINDGDPITPLSVAIAIVPGLAVVGYFWAMGRYIVELKDEFVRMLMVRQSLIATGLAFSAASVWGFLESFEQAPHLDAYWWPILWFFGIGVGAIVNKIQYGTTGEDCS
ncbi:hypothetical protein [Sphingomicrobium flavum]|uniref:hypothetical protein n=1 Tax=Sphingomicrobium flavum TaxID=1229164 RepID=UPI0021AE0599|nr:hypothetical protein [Sphingomicrobium flavum]